MALASLFFKDYITKAKIAQLDIDVSVSENHEASSTLTQTEVEDGANVTDHITLSPIRLTLECIVSKTPLGNNALISSLSTTAGGLLSKAVTPGASSLLGAGINVAGASIGGLVSNALGLDEGGVAGSKGKSRKPGDVYAYLLELRERRTPLQVVTALKLYDSMVLTNLSVPRSNATANIIRFNVTFEQIRFVKAATTGLSGAFASVGGQASDASKLGKQSATSVAKGAADNNDSLLFKAGSYFKVIGP